MDFLSGGRKGRVCAKRFRLSPILWFASALVLIPLGCSPFKTDVALSSPFSPYRPSIHSASTSASAQEPPASVHPTPSAVPSDPQVASRVGPHGATKSGFSRATRENVPAFPSRDPSFSTSVPSSTVSETDSGIFVVSSQDPVANQDHGISSVPSTASEPDSGVDHALFVIPGIAGSGLFATVTNASVASCGKSPISYPNPFRVWASLSLLLPPATHQKCWIDMMKMVVDENGEVYTGQEGVRVEVDGYGGIHAIDYLDYYMNNTYGVPASAYMHVMLRTLMSLHYSQFVTLRGVPYDWRLPPWQLDYAQLKTDIEDRYTEMNNRKVDLIAHSLGSIILCYFLNRIVDQAWKDKYIGSMTIVAAATGGSFKAIKSLLSGYDDATDVDIWNVIDISLFPAGLLRDLLQTMGSIFALLPDPAIYGPDHVVARVARPTQVPASSSASAFAPLTGRSDRAAKKAEGTTSTALRWSHSGEMRRLDAVLTDEVGGPESGARELKSEQAFSLLSELTKDNVEVEKEEAEGETNTRFHKYPDFAPGDQMEEEELAKAEERRDALLREFQLQNRLSHEDRAARQRERYSLFVEKEQRRLDEALRVAQEQRLEEDVYTLSNWTSLLPANLQRRVKTAQEKMAGVVADPGVPVRCIWSKFSQPTTDVAYYYPTGSLDTHPIRIFDYGDNTVPLASLSLCASWPSTVQTKVFDNLDHMFLFADRGFNNFIFDIFSPDANPFLSSLLGEQEEVMKRDIPSPQESVPAGRGAIMADST
ncbi:putative phosphatidylcholine-sterol O-acyltransferase [Toxoplasma gondii RUB]|uniref:Putative phosphatidylcholine-sterol O-acyltransferase n=1 Tax=Toxoplasma gondii RUB TaxID=935652 RepID=A0A086M5E3_TOXGO|nr:putative phosphatidylcholine-sterol O-acyltransferase [Toxoplasma gondii RUB]